MCNQCGHCNENNNNNNKSNKNNKNNKLLNKKIKLNKIKGSLFKDNGQIITQKEYNIECVMHAIEIVNDMFKNFDKKKLYTQSELFDASRINSKDDICKLFIELSNKRDELCKNLY